MDPDRFVCQEFGTVIEDRHQDLNWFQPTALPRSVDLAEHTILALSRADDALGKLAGVGQLLPDEDLLVSPYAMKEALASARIEGTQADLQTAFQEEVKPSRDRQALDVHEVVRYLRALNSGMAEVADAGRLTLPAVRQCHRILMGDSNESMSPVRNRAVWLGSPTDRPETAEFVPPIGQAIHETLADWEEFLNNPPVLPVLIRAALLHYQFLTIHPFVDGNGRAGRLMVLLFLAAENRLPVPLLYLSPYFEERRREYYDRLQTVRERGALQEWLQFFLTAVEAQANDGVRRAKSLLSLREHYRSELAGTRNRSPEVVEFLFENPIINCSLVREQLGMSNQGALNQIRSLERRGWLTELKAVGRGGSKLWLAHEVFKAIEQPMDE